MSKEIVNIPLGETQPHRAQMRTQYAVEALAELTFQMHTRGFDGDKPVLVRVNTAKSGAKYEMVRGHRRRMCWSMCKSLEDGLGKELSLETIQQNWELLILQHGSVESLVSKNVERWSDTTMPAVVQKLSVKDSYAALWSDQYGLETPDIMGEATSFLAGMQAGYSAQSIASHIGKTATYVEGRVSLAILHEDSPDVVERLVSEGALSIGPVLSRLDKAQREGVGLYLLSLPQGAVTASKFIKVIKLLQQWQGFPIPLDAKTATIRNIARAFAAIWDKALDDPGNAWNCVFGFAYQNGDLLLSPPWENTTLIKSWVRSFGLDANNWMQVLTKNLNDVSCETCPVRQLPDVLLKVDLRTPRLPCRLPAIRDRVKRCMHGMAEGDPFHVRVPSNWQDYDGVEQPPEGGGLPFVTSYDDLLKAYNTAKVVEEKAEAVAEKQRKKAAADKKKRDAEIKQQRKQAKAKADAEAAKTPDEPEVSPLELYQYKIRAYMELHTKETGVDHFMATPCQGCAHHMNGDSKDGVPGCAWAYELRSTIRFSMIRPADDEDAAPSIPICHQFMPNVEAVERIPKLVPGVSPIPREVLVAQMTHWLGKLDYQANHGYSLFLWAVGRGMKGKVHKTWLENTLKTNGVLNDGRLYALYVLFAAEWHRCDPDWRTKDRDLYIPRTVSDEGWLWMRATEVDWHPDEAFDEPVKKKEKDNG